MSNATSSGSRTLLWLIALLFVSLFGGRTFAATHTILFGVGGELVYSPAQLDVSVGDVITWQGDFTMHPLRFTSVPDGATTPPDVTSGTSFSYTVEAAGTYDYMCLVHGSLGMTGSFTAVSASVGMDETAVISLWPNPASKLLRIQISDVTKIVDRLEFCNLGGECFNLSADDYVNGSNIIELDLESLTLTPGTYVVLIKTGGDIYRRKLVIEP